MMQGVNRICGLRFEDPNTSAAAGMFMTALISNVVLSIASFLVVLLLVEEKYVHQGNQFYYIIRCIIELASFYQIRRAVKDADSYKLLGATTGMTFIGICDLIAAIAMFYLAATWDEHGPEHELMDGTTGYAVVGAILLTCAIMTCFTRQVAKSLAQRLSEAPKAGVAIGNPDVENRA